MERRLESVQQSFAKVMRVCDITCIVMLEGRGCTSSGGVGDHTAQMLE